MLAAGRHKRVSEVQRSLSSFCSLLLRLMLLSGSVRIRLSAEDLYEFRGVDISAGDDADDLSRTGFAAERAREGTSAAAYRDNVIARDKQAQCFGDRIETREALRLLVTRNHI